jgi:hypothetical protein
MRQAASQSQDSSDCPTGGGGEVLIKPGLYVGPCPTRTLQMTRKSWRLRLKLVPPVGAPVQGPSRRTDRRLTGDQLSGRPAIARPRPFWRPEDKLQAVRRGGVRAGQASADGGGAGVAAPRRLGAPGGRRPAPRPRRRRRRPGPQGRRAQARPGAESCGSSAATRAVRPNGFADSGASISVLPWATATIAV